jgi:acyl-CoA synthetase (AMP-forming)/AMP-acid ligase II
VIEKLWTLLRVRWFPGSVRQAIPRADPDGPAVVLFTSGSEKAPKAVPLTHRNVIADQRAGIPVLEMTRKDAILGFLPPFHSFGLTVTSLLPIFSGMRVVHHPDPTDASNLARKVASYRPTLLVGTPTFVGAILERTKPEELTSLCRAGPAGNRAGGLRRHGMRAGGDGQPAPGTAAWLDRQAAAGHRGQGDRCEHGAGIAAGSAWHADRGRAHGFPGLSQL